MNYYMDPDERLVLRALIIVLAAGAAFIGIVFALTVFSGVQLYAQLAQAGQFQIRDVFASRFPMLIAIDASVMLTIWNGEGGYRPTRAAWALIGVAFGLGALGTILSLT